MNKLEINIWSSIFDIVDIVILLTSWMLVFVYASNSVFNDGNFGEEFIDFMYVIQFIGVILHAIALYRSKINSISIVGNVLGIIGCILSGISLIFALPSVILLIISTVLLFLQHPSNKLRNRNNY